MRYRGSDRRGLRVSRVRLAVLSQVRRGTQMHLHRAFERTVDRPRRVQV